MLRKLRAMHEAYIVCQPLEVTAPSELLGCALHHSQPLQVRCILIKQAVEAVF